MTSPRDLLVLEPAAQAFVEHGADGAVGAAATGSILEQGFVRDLPVPEVEIEDVAVPGGPSGEVPLRIVRRVGAPARLPAILYIHGQSWLFPRAAACDRLARDLVAGTGAAVVLPRCGRFSAARYPAPIEECYAVACWVCERGPGHGLDGVRVAIAGDSVGANIAAVTALLAQERGGPDFCQQVLLCPVTDAALDTRSGAEFPDEFWPRRAAIRSFWDRYTASEHERDHITASPLRADLERLRGLPPALVITAEADMVRDQGEAYAAHLRAAGARVLAVRYQGTIHNFMVVDALAGTESARAAIAQACAALRATFAEK